MTCKKMILPAGESRERNCRHQEWKDGWCHYHHPEVLEEKIVRDFQRLEFESQANENEIVGRWMRQKHNDLFMQMLEDIKDHRTKLRKSTASPS